VVNFVGGRGQYPKRSRSEENTYQSMQGNVANSLGPWDVINKEQRHSRGKKIRGPQKVWLSSRQKEKKCHRMEKRSLVRDRHHMWQLKIHRSNPSKIKILGVLVGGGFRKGRVWEKLPPKSASEPLGKEPDQTAGKERGKADGRFKDLHRSSPHECTGQGNSGVFAFFLRGWRDSQKYKPVVWSWSGVRGRHWGGHPNSLTIAVPYGPSVLPRGHSVLLREGEITRAAWFLRAESGMSKKRAIGASSLNTRKQKANRCAVVTLERRATIRGNGRGGDTRRGKGGTHVRMDVKTELG